MKLNRLKIMKKTIILLALVASILASCNKECNFPPAPYGTPDDVSEYTSTGYNTITYTYYCYNGRYTAVTYTNTESCRWETSNYYSICIK
jgi:hypothetical protein